MYVPQSSTFAMQNTSREPVTISHFQKNQLHQETVEGQVYGQVYYYENNFDPALDWQQHPWNIEEEEDQQVHHLQQPPASNQQRPTGYPHYHLQKSRPPLYYHQNQHFEQPQS